MHVGIGESPIGKWGSEATNDRKPIKGTLLLWYLVLLEALEDSGEHAS